MWNIFMIGFSKCIGWYVNQFLKLVFESVAGDIVEIVDCEIFMLSLTYMDFLCITNI